MCSCKNYLFSTFPEMLQMQNTLARLRAQAALWCYPIGSFPPRPQQPPVLPHLPSCTPSPLWPRTQWRSQSAAVLASICVCCIAAKTTSLSWRFHLELRTQNCGQLHIRQMPKPTERSFTVVCRYARKPCVVCAARSWSCTCFMTDRPSRRTCERWLIWAKAPETSSRCSRR